jgi:hypothetical protein
MIVPAEPWFGSALHCSIEMRGKPTTKTAGDAHFAAINRRPSVEVNHCLRRHARVRLTPLLLTISLILMTSVASHAEPIGARACARWLDGREQHLSTTMETWVAGYVASSNQWALALGLADVPLLVPDLLQLIDQNCKSNPGARLENVVLDVIRSALSRRKPQQKAPSVNPR